MTLPPPIQAEVLRPVTKKGLRAKLKGATSCKRCLDEGFLKSTCAYCDAPLSARHEHDHMPVPLRAGGVEWVPVCINCHDLKDRTNPADWDREEFRKALADAPPLARIILAKLLGDLHELQAELDAK